MRTYFLEEVTTTAKFRSQLANEWRRHSTSDPRVIDVMLFKVRRTVRARRREERSALFFFFSFFLSKGGQPRRGGTRSLSRVTRSRRLQRRRPFRAVSSSRVFTNLFALLVSFCIHARYPRSRYANEAVFLRSTSSSPKKNKTNNIYLRTRIQASQELVTALAHHYQRHHLITKYIAPQSNAIVRSTSKPQSSFLSSFLGGKGTD